MKQLICLCLLTSFCLAAKPDFWIDVRSKKEFDADHLKEAVNIPHDQIVEGIAKLTKDKDAVIYLYCRTGGRSWVATEKLKKAGYTKVENKGGLEEVREELGRK